MKVTVVERHEARVEFGPSRLFMVDREGLSPCGKVSATLRLRGKTYCVDGAATTNDALDMLRDSLARDGLALEITANDGGVQ